MLLQEEMRRVMAYHSWHADWWEMLAFMKTDLPAPVQAGSIAYAFWQAAIRRLLCDDCQRQWQNVDAYVAGLVGITVLNTGTVNV